MAQELSRSDERRGTRRLVIGGAVVAAILLVVTVMWPLVLENKLSTPNGGANPSTTPDLTAANGLPMQRAAESTVGKSNPGGQDDSTGGRARQIEQSSQPLQLSDQQKQQVKQVLAQESPPRTEKANFELMIGTAVPRQTELKDIPPEITRIMNGYWGDQYLVAGDTMIIVDQHSRRVVAIVPGVT
jgi:Protein of unknown function (DUF1236)